MGGCSIRKCKSRSVKGGTIRFFSIPKDESVAKEWLRHCGAKTTMKNGKVCSNHFLPTDYLKKPLMYVLLNRQLPKSAKRLKSEAVPTLFLEQHTNNEMATTSDLIEETNAKKSVSFSLPETTKVVCVPDVQPSNNQITIPQTEYIMLNRKLSEYNELKTNLARIFTPGQMRCLLKPQRNKKRTVKWSAEDMSAAVSLLNVSPNCYRHLKNNVGIPLPGLSTIARWNNYKKSKETDSNNAGTTLPNIKPLLVTIEVDVNQCHNYCDIQSDGNAV